MRAGAKVGILAAALCAAVGAALWLVGEDGPRAVEETSAAPTPAPTPTPARPRSARAEKARGPKLPPVEEDALAPTKHASADCKLTGTVVDSEGKPVGGALVRAARAGEPVDQTKSDAEGRFALRCGRRPATESVEIGLTATSGASHAAFVAYELGPDSPDEDDVGELAVEIAIPLVARVECATGPVAGARVFLGTFFGTVFATATTDARGVARFDMSPVADGWLFAYAKGKGRCRGEIPDRRDPAVPLVLRLTSRSVRVAVVRTPPDVPLVGETVAARVVTETDEGRLFTTFVPPAPIAPTGPDGTTTIEDVGLEDAVEVRRVGAAAGAPWIFDGLRAMPATAGPRETDVRIEAPAGRTIRWRLVAGEAPPPPEGALVRLRASAFGRLPAGPSALRVEGGELVGSGFAVGAIEGTAQADDGSIAAIYCTAQSDAGRDTSFRRPRRIEVLLREESGAAVVGAQIQLSSQDGGRAVGAAVATDADGAAVFSDLEPALGRVSVRATSSSPNDVRYLGVVDLAKGDGRIEARLPRPRDVVLRVTTEGERKLPPQWSVFSSGRTLDAQGDVAAAEIRLAARPPSAAAPLRLLVVCQGLRNVELELPPDVATADVALDRGGTLLVEVRALPGQKPQSLLQRWDEATKSWQDGRLGGFLGTKKPDADGRLRFEGLTPGRFRLYDPPTRVVSDPVEVTLGATPTLVFDLTRSGTVRGRVLGPDDKPVPDAWIDVEDDAWRELGTAPGMAFGFRMRFNANPKGEFAATVPGDRKLRLRVGHALMRPDGERGVVEVVEPREGVVLRLVPGPVLEFAVPAGVRVVFAETIQLFRGLDAPPVARLTAVFEDGRLRAGGFDPGRYTVFIDFGNAAPAVLPDVELKDGTTDLGEIRPARGSTVRVRLPAQEGASKPVGVQLVRVGQPRYVRGASSTETEVVVPGLGPGRFQVTVSGAGAPRTDATPFFIDVDGERDAVIDWPPK